MNTGLQEALEVLKVQYTQEIEELRKTHREELALKDQENIELRTANAILQSESAKAIETINRQEGENKRLQKELEERQREIGALEKKLLELEEKHTQEIEELRKTHREELASKDQENIELQELVKALKDQIDVNAQKLKQQQGEIKTLGSKIESLELEETLRMLEGIFDDRMRFVPSAIYHFVEKIKKGADTDNIPAGIRQIGQKLEKRFSEKDKAEALDATQPAILLPACLLGTDEEEESFYKPIKLPEAGGSIKIPLKVKGKGTDDSITLKVGCTDTGTGPCYSAYVVKNNNIDEVKAQAISYILATIAATFNDGCQVNVQGQSFKEKFIPLFPQGSYFSSMLDPQCKNWKLDDRDEKKSWTGNIFKGRTNESERPIP